MKLKNFYQIISFLIALLILGSFYLFINLPSSVATPESFSIAKGESIVSIGSRLKQKNFIYSDFLFYFYLRLTKQASNIKAGYYLLPGKLSLVQLVNMITDAKNINDGIFLIKEGDTLNEIEAHLRQRGILIENNHLSDFRIKDFISLYPRLFSEIPLDNNLEGFLFPDSYHFPPHASARDIIITLLNNFQSKLEENQLLTQKKKLSFYENLILASLLEKEVQTEQDKRLVADILNRRLEAGIPLQLDATICYAQNQSFDNCHLTLEAFKIDSPYNTYLYKGLPPTPICNPGLESLKAVFNPLSNQFWYYLTDRKTGRTIYSQTFEEHQQARQKYL